MQVENKYSEYTISTKIDEIKDDFPKSLIKPLHDVVTKEKYVSYVIEKRSISTVGGNYLSILYEVDIKGRTEKENKETNIFIKCMLGNEQKIFSISDAYLKERFAYSELSLIFSDVQEKANVPQKERFKMVKSYDAPIEAIMLDNLTKRGFTTPYRMDPMSLKFAQLSIEQLAKFHGLSYVLETLRPDFFNEKIRVMPQPFKFSESWTVFYKNMFDLMTEHLSEERAKKLRKLLPEYIEKCEQYYRGDKLQGCVLCHGDYRPNNILMKEANGEVTEIIPVDYQILYYGCPINDFMYFMMSGSDRKLRKNHLNELKNLYYDTLEKFVAYFNLDIEEFYPRKEFERQYKERFDFGMVVSTYLLPFIFASEEEVPDMGTDDLTTIQFKVDKRYRERIEGIVQDYEDSGYL